MTTKTTRYSLENITNILFNGFDYKLPEETLNIISDIALQVGSPDYVKTPVFQKRENPMKVEPAAKETIITSSKRNRKGKANEVTNDEDWNNIRATAQASSAAAEEKSAFDLEIENIRLQLNKLTDKNYNDILKQIGYIESVIMCGKLRKKVLCVPEMINYKNKIYDDNVNKINDVLEYAINNKLSIEPQIFITHDDHLKQINDLFHQVN